MQKNTIITIGRQFGSGGREIAKGLSEALSIPFYDSEIITAAAKKSGMNENLFKNVEERPTTSLLYSLAMSVYPTVDNSSGVSLASLNDTIFQVQSKVITNFAAQGSCVFVGRCADYVLRSVPGCYHFFIYADADFKRERVARLYQLSEKAAEDLMTKTDKKRASYYNYYTGKKWNAFENYDLCINSAKAGIEGTIEMVLAYLRQKERI